MTISPLSVQQIVAVIRQQMTDTIRPRSTESNVVNVAPVKKGEPRRIRPANPKKTSLGKVIAGRIKALDKDDPDRGRKAFRIFLESVLINEFGGNLINDPAFYQLVEDIHQQMENTPEIADAIQTATLHLLTSSASDT